MSNKIKTVAEKTNEPKKKIIIAVMIFIVLLLIFKFFQWRSEAIAQEQAESLTAAKKEVDITDKSVISLDKQAAIENKIQDIKLEKEVLEEKVIGLSQKDKARQAEVESLLSKMERLLEDLNQTKQKAEQEKIGHKKDILRLQNQIVTLSKENKKITLPPLQLPGLGDEQKAKPVSENVLPDSQKIGTNSLNETTLEKQKKETPKQEDIVAFSFFSTSNKNEEESVIVNMNDSVKLSDDKEVEEQEIPYVIRMGFVDAVSLTGVKVPVEGGGGATSASDTYPIFLKIGSKSLGSNNHTQDLRNCIAMAAARGNRNSNRVMAHIIKISCTDPSGTRRYEASVEGDGVNGYVYGDDNILGIPGIKEDLSGEHIGKSLLAGFVQGVANAFTQVPSMVGITGEVKETGASTFSDGFASGTSQSLGNIARYYMEQAKSFLPVISIKAGRKVSIGFGADIEFKSVEFKTVFVNTPFEYLASDDFIDLTKKPQMNLE